MSRLSLGVNSLRGGNDQFTSLLLHCDGTDGATSFPDASYNGLTVTANGNAQVDTAWSQFGSGSLLLDGSGDSLTIADNALLEFGSGDFTVDLWVRPSSVSGAGAVFDRGGGASSAWLIQRAGTAYQFFASSTGATYDIANGASLGSAALNTPAHLMVARQGSSIRLFNNGSLTATVTSSAAIFNSTTALYIGVAVSGVNGFAGWLDEIRIDKGIARRTAAFTPSSAAYF